MIFLLAHHLSKKRRNLLRSFIKVPLDPFVQETEQSEGISRPGLVCPERTERTHPEGHTGSDAAIPPPNRSCCPIRQPVLTFPGIQARLDKQPQEKNERIIFDVFFMSSICKVLWNKIMIFSFLSYIYSIKCVFFDV